MKIVRSPLSIANSKAWRTNQIDKAVRQFNKRARFCTPGHKGRLLKSDITEVEGEFPLNIIKASQQKTALIFGANALRYLVNGSSIGIKASLMAFKGDVLAAQNCHQSIHEAAALAHKKLILIKNNTKNGLSLPLTKEQLEQAVKENPTIGTVVLAHPDYYGLNASIEAAQFVKQSGKMLYVDAAHGAHYLFRDDLFDCTIFSLADAFNLSAHKTLYSLTQTAYLCINNRELIEQIDFNLTLLGTTSPFYPFYSSLENAARYNLKYAHRYNKLKSEAFKLRQTVKCVDNHDFTRLVVNARGHNKSGKQLFEQLKKSGITAEKYDENYVVFILTLSDTKRKIKHLRRTLEKLCTQNL